MPFRDAGFFDPRELLIAEAIQARAWECISRDKALDAKGERNAKAQLAKIVIHLMTNRERSIGDLSAAAVEAFKIG